MSLPTNLPIPDPVTLGEIAARAGSWDEFGRNLRGWRDGLRRVSTRVQATAAIAEEPALLQDKFPEGHAADAWLAAYAEHLAEQAGIDVPSWAFAPERTAAAPVFDAAADNPALLTRALSHSPRAFQRRNIFTPAVELPLSIRAGRPAKSPEEKRRTNAARQRRFRQARLEELTALRALARQDPTRSARLPQPPSPISNLRPSPPEPDYAAGHDLPSFLK